VAAPEVDLDRVGTGVEALIGQGLAEFDDLVFDRARHPRR
jgi:hypothetical protein